MRPRAVLLMISSMRGGGSERQTLMLLRHLDRARFVPHLYLTERDGDLLSQVPADVQVHAYSDQPTPSGIYYPGRVLAHQVRHIERLLARESISVVYDRTFHMTLIAGPAAKRQGAARVSTIVSPPDVALPMVERRFVGLKRRRLASAYRDACQVVAVSRQAADAAERYYRLPSDSMTVIPNPVDIEQVRGASEQTAPQRDDRLTICCVGRMTEEKGHRDLLEAVAMTESRWPADVEPLSLWLIGDGPLREALESQWHATDCRHEVRFLGQLDGASSAIAAADGLVLPSHFEGMPNVVLEAMTLGTPVIATRAGGTIELQADEPTILWAEPKRPESIADALIEFATDRRSAKARAEAAARLVVERHDVRSAAARVGQLLEDCGAAADRRSSSSNTSR